MAICQQIAVLKQWESAGHSFLAQLVSLDPQIWGRIGKNTAFCQPHASKRLAFYPGAPSSTRQRRTGD
jgi:hypothetical protein